VHLPDKQVVTFNHREGLAVQVEHRRLGKTTLMEFFEVCQNGIGNAGHLLYVDIPTHYILDTLVKEWRVRRRVSRLGVCQCLAHRQEISVFFRLYATCPWSY